MYRYRVVLSQYISDTIDITEDGHLFHALLKEAHVRLQQEWKSDEAAFFCDRPGLPGGERGVDFS